MPRTSHGSVTKATVPKSLPTPGLMAQHREDSERWRMNGGPRKPRSYSKQQIGGTWRLFATAWEQCMVFETQAVYLYALVMVLLSSLIDKSYYIAGPITDICTHTRLQPLFRDNLGKPVPERSNQTGFKWGKIDKSYYIAGPITDICTHTRLQPLFRDNLGKPVPERSNQTGFKWGKRLWGFGMQWHQSSPRCRQISTPTPHHSILQAGCSSWRPTNSVKALKAWHR